MRINEVLRHIPKDLVKGGPRFLLDGVLVGLSKRPTRQIALRGGGHASVRPGDSDFSTFRQVFRDRDYEIGQPDVEKRVRDAYDAMLASGATPVIVDAGANIGAATMWFSRQFPDAVTVAIEPDPGNAKILRFNIKGLPQARMMEAAIGGEAGFVTLRNEGQSWAVQTVRESSGLPIVTVADAVSSVKNGRLFIAKIDIEGFESDLFSGETGWLDDALVVYIEPHDWMLPGKRTSRNFQREMAKRDFEIFLKGENLMYVR